jgi:hypothetical protein
MPALGMPHIPSKYMSKVFEVPNGTLLSYIAQAIGAIIPFLRSTASVEIQNRKIILEGWCIKIDPARPTMCVTVYQGGTPVMSIGVRGAVKRVVVPDDMAVTFSAPPCDGKSYN